MSKRNNKIFVTKPFLPPIETYLGYVKKIWVTSQLTNNGPLVKQLEMELKEFLAVKHLFYVANGTIALQIAIKALDLKKEIITTPFSYVATVDSILWENCKPVFVDINETDYCINVSKIEEKITKDTQAILAVHIFGNPCDVEAIESIAKKHKLKVIYDGAHAFATKVNNKSILTFGDISTLSFHATKLFHTAEGGAIITNDDEIAKKIYLYRNFGHPEDDILSVGINGKNSEFHAALGLSILPEVKTLIKKRRKISKVYNNILKNEDIKTNHIPLNVEYNYSYYPIVFNSESTLARVKNALEKNEIYPRRYFYPSLNKLPFLKGDGCAISESVARRVLCLPLYPDLELKDAENIATLVKNSLSTIKSSRKKEFKNIAERLLIKNIIKNNPNKGDPRYV